MRLNSLVQAKHKLRNGLMAAMFMSTQLIAVASPFAAPVKVGATGNDKVTICHRTASYSNPYVKLSVDKNAVDGIAGNSGNEADHYGEHKGPIFYPAIPKHTEWGDIIPPVSGAHSGLNWTSAGQAILYNDCKLTDSGSVQVNKKVDTDGNGVYEGSNTTANNLDFDWLLGDDPTARDMGTTVSGVPEGNHTVTETGGPAGYVFTGWYYTSQEDNHGSGQVNCTYPQGTTLPVTVNVEEDETSKVTLCNQFKPGSIKIVKDAQPNHSQDFTFTTSGSGVSNFTLDDDGSESTSGSGKKSNVQFNGLAPGSYTFTEADVSGWDLSNISCTGQGQSTIDRQGNTLSVTLATGENLVCTFINQKRGHIIVQKTTIPAGSQTQFSISASGTGTVTSGASGSISDATDHDYTVTPGTYSVTETVPEGWGKTGDTCQGLVVAPGATVTCQITNTKLGSISGTKFNVNKDDTVGDGLGGWTIFIDTNDNGELDVDEQSTVTDENGAYSFSDLLPGNFVLKEVLTSGWVQIFGPGSVNLGAGQNSTGNDFGNQGHGSIKVNKNVDTDGDGDVDVTGAENWTWDIDGSGDYQTGTTQNVAAGSYAVSEDQQDNYHFVSVSCWVGDYELKLAQAESIQLNVEAGDQVVCTFTNARDTAKIKVNKVVAPSQDDGEFDLLIGEEVYAEGVGDGGTTGWVSVPTGTYSVSEQAAEGTDLDDYVTTNSCSWGERGGEGEGTSVSGLEVEANDELTCTFYNTRQSEVVVTKFNDLNRNGWMDEGEEFSEPTLEGWEFTLVGNMYCDWESEDVYDFLEKVSYVDCDAVYGYDKTQTTGEDGTTTFSGVQPGEAYQLTETLQEGWHLSVMYCDNNWAGWDGDTYYLSDEDIAPGATVECYVGNYRDADLDITKENDTTGEVTPGTMVTYTLTVSVPEDAGMVFDAIVYDELPDGVTYVPGSWTSTSATTTDPLFNPIGKWKLGDMYPGDTVVLTYQATVDEDAADGTYTNVAFAEGCAVPSRSEQVLSRTIIVDDYKCPDPVTTDNVTSDVVVDTPQVLGTTTPTTPLANTGANDVVRNALIGLTIVMMTIALAFATRRQRSAAN